MTDCPTVLIADDETSCIDLVRQTLEKLPCEVIAAADGEQALQLARRHKPSVIILDVQMPKKNGFQVFGELRADNELAGIPVIMLTAIAQRTGMKFNAAEMEDYMGSEPEAYLDKPIEPLVLRQTVKKLLS